MLHVPFSRFAMQIIFVREIRARVLWEIDTLQSIRDRNIREIDVVGRPTVSFVLLMREGNKLLGQRNMK